VAVEMVREVALVAEPQALPVSSPKKQKRRLHGGKGDFATGRVAFSMHKHKMDAP
jgi:hypothetical protein